MKKLTLLLLLMMAPGLGGQSVAFLNQAAAAASAPREALSARPVSQQGSGQLINALGEKNYSNEKKLPPGGLTNEVDAKRLKLVFLLMMSLGQSRTPVH